MEKILPIVACAALPVVIFGVWQIIPLTFDAWPRWGFWVFWSSVAAVMLGIASLTDRQTERR
jgi:hypothetical protein